MFCLRIVFIDIVAEWKKINATKTETTKTESEGGDTRNRCTLGSIAKTKNESIVYISAHLVQVSIQTPCCRRWYECPECHDERENHPMSVGTNVVSVALFADPDHHS